MSESLNLIILDTKKAIKESFQSFESKTNFRLINLIMIYFKVI